MDHLQTFLEESGFPVEMLGEIRVNILKYFLQKSVETPLKIIGGIFIIIYLGIIFGKKSM